jgi:adenylate cyclase
MESRMPVKKERFVPIGVKLIGIISFIIVAALSGMTLLATAFFRNEVERSTELTTFERADLVSQKVETELRTFQDRGKLLAAALEGGIAFSDTGVTLTELFFSQDEDILATGIVARDADGALVLRSAAKNAARLELIGEVSGGPLEWLGGQEDALAAAFRGSFAVRNASTAFRYPVIALVFPHALKSPGEAESVVALFISMDRILDAIKAGELYVTFLTGQGGEILGHPDQQLIVERASMRASPIVRDALASNVETKQIKFKEGGKTYLGSYRKFLEGTLTVSSVVEESKAMAAVYKIQERNVYITAMILCVAILGIFFFSKSLTEPIRRLVEGTSRIREGEFTVDIPVTGHDELGRLTLAFTEMGRGLAEREKIKAAFGRFVNKEVAERVLRDEISLGGETKRVAVFFSDIRSFTAISEKLEPHEVVEFLNEYMSRMVECVNKTHGVVDKFIGDAIMAVWGAPYSVGNDMENAIDGALMMRESLVEFNKGRGGGPEKAVIRIGCGINYGPVVAGQIGSTERMEYTVIGDTVNLASRIESLNKPFRTDILICQEAYEKVRGIFKVEPMKRITVKGKAEPQQIYAVVGRLDDKDCPPSLDAVRTRLGIATGELDEDLDPDAKEEKYEILE